MHANILERDAGDSREWRLVVQTVRTKTFTFARATRGASVRLAMGVPGPGLASPAQGRAGLRRWPPGSGLMAPRRSLSAPLSPSSHVAPRCFRGGQQGSCAMRSPHSLRAAPLQTSVPPIGTRCILTLLPLCGAKPTRFSDRGSPIQKRPQALRSPRRVLRPHPSATCTARLAHSH